MLFFPVPPAPACFVMNSLHSTMMLRIICCQPPGVSSVQFADACAPYRTQLALVPAQVWPSGLRSVTAVERSPTMLHFNTTHMRQAAAANPAGTPAVAGADEEGSSPKHAHLGSSPSYSGIPSHPHSAQVRGASAAGPRVTWMRGLPRLPGKDGAAVVPPRWAAV
eukprot:1161617-Pelagomonas_calceolata.AAC.11